MQQHAHFYAKTIIIWTYNKHITHLKKYYKIKQKYIKIKNNIKIINTKIFNTKTLIYLIVKI